MSKKILFENNPISNVQWVHRDNLLPNNYNPNSVAPPEFKLLHTSLQKYFWCMAIICLDNFDGTHTIIDGFHRWKKSGDPQIYALTDGYVPIISLQLKTEEERMAATVVFNRAKGTHAVMPMASMVAKMINAGRSMQWIMQSMGMEREEVIRLANQEGIPKSDIIDGGFSEAWGVK